MRCILRALGVFGLAHATHADDHPTTQACSFLVSLFVLDMGCWAVGRAIVYEIILLGEDLGWSKVGLSASLTTVEVMVEVTASYLTPRLHRWVEDKAVLSARSLSHFALKAYLISSLLGLLLYPPFALVLYILDVRTAATLVALAVAHSIQYPAINQVGDQAVEMGMPHWMATFRDTELCFPGSSCCAALQLKVPSSPGTLSVFLTLVKFVLAILFSLLYLGARSVSVIRWSFVLTVCLLNFVTALCLHRAGARLTKAVKDRQIDQPSDTTPFFELGAVDRSLVVFAVVAFSVPEQAFSAAVAIAVLNSSSVVVGGAVVVASVVVLFVLIRRLKQEGVDAGRDDQLQPFSQWTCLLATMTALLALSSLLLYLGDGSTVTVYAAMALLVPFAAVSQNLEANFTQLLFVYPEKVSTDIQFWRNVLNVVVNAPLLAVNWTLLAFTDSETKQLGAVAGVAVVLLLVATLFYLIVDPQCAEGITAAITHINAEDLSEPPAIVAVPSGEIQDGDDKCVSHSMKDDPGRGQADQDVDNVTIGGDTAKNVII
eukprot:TRINITY_DN10384_c0_g1_i1.p1 TRINITY_DN10384_c0_g1~~TRINITY_DN10384_c0_g1_i1.p1  ORF type:complete len:544 (-),score=110.11 TRINITY_DN10384_c0_g1_i1:15-1646(-)